MLQQVTKIIGMDDMGDDGSTSRLEKAKEMGRRTLERAEKGDSVEKKTEIEWEAETKKAEDGKKREKDKLRKEKLQQGRVEQERFEKKRVKEKKIKREERLEVERFEEERFEEERRIRKEKRREIRKWLEDKKNCEAEFKKMKKEEKQQKSGKEKVVVEIKNIEGKTLIEYEHGKSETGVRVRISSRLEPGRRGPHLDASHHQEGDSGNDDKLDDKPKVYRSRGVSDLVKLFESQSQETKTMNEKVQRAVSKSPEKKKKTAKKEAQTVEKKAAEKQSTPRPQNVSRPHVHQVPKTYVSENCLHKGPQSATSEAPRRPLQSQPKASSAPSVGAVTSKPRLERLSESSNNNSVTQQANTEMKVSATRPNPEKKPSKPEPKQRSEKGKETIINVLRREREGMKNLPTPQPLNEDFPRIKPANKHQQPSDPRIHPTNSKSEGAARVQDNSTTEAKPPTLPKEDKLPKASNPEPAPQPASPRPRSPRRGRTSEDTKDLRAEMSSTTTTKFPLSAWRENPSFREPQRPLKEIRLKATLYDSNSLAGECGSTPALTNASTLTNTLVNSMKVEYTPSERSTITTDSMKVEPSSSDIHRGECGSTVSNTSIGSMVVEVDSIDPPTLMNFISENLRSWGCGTTPGLTVAGSVPATSVDSLKVEYSPSDQLSSASVDSLEAEYSPSAQSELWQDILQRLGVEAEKETGSLVHPENCGCLGCLKEP